MKKTILLFLGFGCFAHQAEAGGFKIGMQGIKQIGMGHTGVGFAQDAATVYFNPAGMSFVNNQLIGGVNALIPTTSFLEKNTNAVTDATTKVYTPFSAYGVLKLSKRVNFGIGAYTPFGSGIQYTPGWAGKNILTQISLENIYIQPTLSYRLSDHLSLGAGVVFSHGTVNLEKDLPISSSNPFEPAHAQLNGKATGSGYNVGIYYKGEKNFNLGVAYHSKVTMSVTNGDAYFTNIPSALASSFPAANSFKTELNLPSELAVGTSMKLSRKVTFAADFNYTFWNTFDSLGFDYAVNSASLTDSKSPRLYENAMALRAGIQADVHKNVQLRAGAFYDQTPVQDGYVAPELPDNNKVGLTTGASFMLEERLQLDLSLLYENVPSRTQRNIETGLNGTFKTKAFAPGVGLKWAFAKKMNHTKNY